MAKLTDTQRIDFLAKHAWISVARKEGGEAYLAVGGDHPIHLPLRDLIDIAHKQDLKQQAAKLEAAMPNIKKALRRMPAKRRVKK